MGRGESTGRRGIPRRVKGRLVNDGVEAHVGMLDPEIVSIEPVLWPEVMIPESRTLSARVHEVPFLVHPATEHKAAHGTTKARH